MRTLLECYKILEEYPNGMTKDQFYRVARINKQHAKYLLDSGLVPCTNTGKKTRKYHIATHDVIDEKIEDDCTDEYQEIQEESCLKFFPINRLLARKDRGENTKKKI